MEIASLIALAERFVFAMERIANALDRAYPFGVWGSGAGNIPAVPTPVPQVPTPYHLIVGDPPMPPPSVICAQSTCGLGTCGCNTPTGPTSFQAD